MNEAEKSKPKFNKIKKNAVLINILLFILIVSTALLSPIFSVRSIIVNGTAVLNDEKVVLASKIELGKNTFLFRTSRAEEFVKTLSYVEEVTIKRSFPSSVVINITECKPDAQISCDNSIYLIIDKNKKILDTSTERLKYSVPVIEGMNIEKFEIGAYLEPGGDIHFNTMMSILTELSENEMHENTKRIYYDECYLIEYANGITCDLEKGTDITYKIKFLKEAISNIPEGKKGTIEFVDEYKDRKSVV